MTSALVSSSSCASTTAVCSRRPFHRKSSGIKTTKRYAQKILSRFAIFSFSFSSRFPANRLTDGANFLSLFYSLISIHRRISITPRAENEGDSASTTTPAASAAPKLVPSNAASIKVHERIRLEKFCFFCFSRSKSFFFFVPLSLSGEIVSLSLSSSRKYTTGGRQKSDERRDFLCRQHKRFFVRTLLCFSAKREGKYYSEKLLLTVSLAALIKKI